MVEGNNQGKSHKTFLEPILLSSTSFFSLHFLKKDGKIYKRHLQLVKWWILKPKKKKLIEYCANCTLRRHTDTIISGPLDFVMERMGFTTKWIKSPLSLLGFSIRAPQDAFPLEFKRAQATTAIISSIIYLGNGSDAS